MYIFVKSIMEAFSFKAASQAIEENERKVDRHCP